MIPSTPKLQPAPFYTYYSDPGHGWLQVSAAECRALGIYHDISQFSKISNDFVYLEEDCDFALWRAAWRSLAPRFDPNIREETTPYRGGVRDFPSFSPQPAPTSNTDEPVAVNR